MSGSKLSPFGEKHARSNSGSLAGARAEAVIGERGLMRLDEGHAVGRGIAAQHAGLAGRERLQLRQEFVLHEARDVGEPLRIGVEGRMDVEAGAAAAGRARRHSDSAGLA